MKRSASFHILVIALVALLTAVACSAGEESQTREELGEHPLQLPTAEAKDLASLGEQAAIGDSLTLDASVLPGPIGEPALSGNIEMTVNSTERDVKVEEDTVPKLGGAYGAGLLKGEQYTAKRGVYFIVNYTVKNETDGLLKPGAHINNGFTLADTTGREWKPMTFQADHFDGSAAFALQQDLFDPREFVLQGEEGTTVIAFDIASDASDLRLRSEVLGIEIKLDY